TMLTVVGPFLDYYVDPHAGLHLQAAVGYGILALGEGRGATRTNLVYVQEQSGGGITGLVGAGYEWWTSDAWSVGILARLTFGWGSPGWRCSQPTASSRRSSPPSTRSVACTPRTAPCSSSYPPRGAGAWTAGAPTCETWLVWSSAWPGRRSSCVREALARYRE